LTVKSDAPQLIAPAAGESIRADFKIKVGRPELVLTEACLEPGKVGVEPHIHHHHADAFYVLEGELLVRLGEEEARLGAGGFVLVPPELVHSFRNPGPERACYLNIHAPGMGFDDYVRSGFRADFDQHDPPPDGGRPASEALVHAPGEGRHLALGDSRATIKAGTGDALDSLALLELELAPGFPGPVLHRHERMTDSFYVLEGELTLQLGEERVGAPSRSYAYVPPGNAHTFAVSQLGRVRVLNLMAPAGLERYLEEVAALGGPPDPAQMAEFASRYDFRAV
jgi:mannose-6-phosphate isomerase-like protein (cupin superfamily)